MADPQQQAAPITFSNVTPLHGADTAAPAQPAAPAAPAGGGITFSNIQPLPGADSSAATPPPANNASMGATGALSDVAEDVAGAGSGILKGAGDTVSGVAHLINKIPGIGETLAPKQGIGALDQMDKSNSTAESVGKGVEGIAEFFAGDAALEGLAKAAKITALASKYPLIAKTLELAKAHPAIAKIIAETGKGAAVGAAQGTVKGAQQGDATQGAEAGGVGGAVGGLAGGAVAETMGAAAKEIGERVGLVPNVTRDASIGMKPRKGNLNAVSDFMRIGPKLDAINQADGGAAATHEDWANIAKQAREDVYQKTVEPLLQTYGDRPLSGIDIRNRISSDIPEALKKFSPEKAAAVEEFANQFMPGQRFEMQAKDAENYIQHLNAELAGAGYWKLDPASRAALEKTNPDIIKWKAGADAIRDELYGKLGDWQTADHVANPVDMAAAKKDYGAARNVENELRGQINVQNRQSKISLKEMIALAAGVAHGGPAGAAVAALPVADKIINSPAASFGRAVKAVSRPTEGVGPAAVRAGQAVKGAVENNAGNAGAQLGRLFFTASDGSTHSIPDNENALAHAKSIDPGLQIHPAQQ
jgi:hypothetical protein